MKIWINRAGQNLGTFTLEEVQRGLDQGQFVPSDLAWQEGMASWKPLADFPGLRLPPPEPLPPPVAAVRPEGDGDTAVAVPTTLDGSAPSWERGREIGWVRAYFLTIREVLFEPTNTFQRFNPHKGISAPTWFFLVTIAIQGVFAFGFEALTLPYNRAAVDLQKQLNLSLVGLLLILPLLLVFGLLLTLIANFVLVGLYHLTLKVLRGASLPYQATYRVVTYSHAAQIFGVVPCLGPIVAMVMFMIAAAVGLQRVHQTEYWKAVLALVVPYLLCFAVVLLIFSSIITVLLHASHHAQA
ncbi:MAG: YIP1 family protein [Verrucomicrobia bacterium]|nr:YIP1 family protein [Verrucomicrobiota bacterium]